MKGMDVMQASGRTGQPHTMVGWHSESWVCQLPLACAAPPFDMHSPMLANAVGGRLGLLQPCLLAPRRALDDTLLGRVLKRTTPAATTAAASASATLAAATEIEPSSSQVRPTPGDATTISRMYL